MRLLERRQVFPARIEELRAILTFVVTAAEEAGVPPSRLPYLELALDETVTNLCNYAYEGTTGDIDIRVNADEQRFEVEFSDRGVAFNPLDVGAPDLSSDLLERKLGGLGVFFMRQMMDDAHYRRDDNRNILTMVMNLP